MIIQPHFTTGWFKKKCVTCGEKTKERMSHSAGIWVKLGGGCAMYDFDHPKIPQHFKCHDKTCTDEGCLAYRQAQVKAAEAMAEVLSPVRESC